MGANTLNMTSYVNARQIAWLWSCT